MGNSVFLVIIRIRLILTGDGFILDAWDCQSLSLLGMTMGEVDQIFLPGWHDAQQTGGGSCASE